MSGFPKIRLIAVGKIKKSWIQDGILLYQKRLPELSVTEVKDSTKEKEAAQILSLTQESDRLIVMTEEGKTCSSTDFASQLEHVASGSLVFVIGGPDGLHADLKQHAYQRLSLSPMTFPHEIARLLLIEQLYRAKTILQNGNYHK